MSSSYHRGQVDRLSAELARLEGKEAGSRDKAARERAQGLRASQSVTPSTSASSAKSKLQSAQRHEARAVGYDQEAARYASQISTKRKALAAAQSKVSGAEQDQRRRTEEELRRAQTRTSRGRSQPIVVRATEQSVVANDEVKPGDVASPDDESHPTSVSPESTADAALEIARAAAIGALGAVPVLGPILSEVIGVAWGSNRAERLERFAIQLGRDVEAIADRIDTEFVRRDEFHGLAEEAIERVVLRRNQAKIDRFSAAVANAATTERPDERARERYLDLLNDLRPVHLELLARLATPRPDWERPPDVLTVGQVVNSRLAFALQDLDYDRTEFAELQRRGLVASFEDQAVLLHAAEDIGRIVTPFGRGFLRYLTIVRTAPAIDQ
jgi:hypothetical protein